MTLPKSTSALQAALAPVRSELGLAAEPPPSAPPPAPIELVEAALAEGATIVSTGLGDPAPLIPLARAAGAPVLAMVATVADARHAVASGADVIVAQGSEAGGHRSNFQLPAYFPSSQARPASPSSSGASWRTTRASRSRRP